MQNGGQFPNGNQQQLKNIMAYNQLDLSPGVRDALMSAQAQALSQGNGMQMQPQFNGGPPPQQMEMGGYGINSGLNMMQYPQNAQQSQQPFQQQAQDQRFQSMRQQPPMMMQAPMYKYSPHNYSVQVQQQQDQFMGSQYNQMFMNQQQPDPEEQRDEIDDNIDEFDSDFLMNNPGIVQTQKYFEQNYEQVLSNNQMNQEHQPILARDDNLWRNMNINLANNNYNHKKKFGLNKNKRGKIKDTDFQRLQSSIRNQYSQRNEQYLNQQFGQQPQLVVQKFRQNKAKLEQQFMHRQYQSQGNILQVLSNLDEQIQSIGERQSIFQNLMMGIEDLPQQLNVNHLYSQNSQNQVQNPQFMADMQQDALKRIRDQVKEELKEELKNQIRQELIDQLPKESKDALAKKGLMSNSMFQRVLNPSKFQGQNNQLSEALDSNGSKVEVHQAQIADSNGIKKNFSGAEIGNQSLNQYKFGMINESSDHESKEKGGDSKNSKGSKQSRQSFGEGDSDKLESERLRRSYDEYGKMINDQLHKKIDYKNDPMSAINEDQDSDNNDNSSLELGNNVSKDKKHNLKQIRSASLAPIKDNQNDLLLKQLDQIKDAQKRNLKAKRNNSIHVGNALAKRDSKCGTEGENDHVRNFNNYLDDADGDQEHGQYDFLYIQIEDERLKMLNEIHQIVQRQDDLLDDIDESNLNNKLKLICKNMMDLNIEYSVSKILELSKKEKRILRDLIQKYQEILMHQSKYVNVEHLDNELKSDVGDDYDDEDDEENVSESEGQLSSSDCEVENRSIRSHQKVHQKKAKKQNPKDDTDNSDNDVQYENYMPKIDPKAIKLRNERRGSIISIGSRRVMQQQIQEQEPKQKKKIKKKFDSDESENAEDDDDDDNSVSQEGSEQEEEEQEEEEAKNYDLPKSPSIAEIMRSSSYRSVDSREKKIASKKFDPKLLKIRDDGSCRGSIRSRSSRNSKKAFKGGDMVSERSGNRRQLSIYRRDKLEGLELDYHEYLQQHQGIFIIRCQMMNIELSKIREKYDLEKMMIDFKNFKKLQKEIKQDEVYRGLQTVIIDIENTFVTLIEVKNKEELDAIKEYENFHSDYIIIKKNVSKKSKKDKKTSKHEDQPSEPDICCEYKGTERCICDLLVYLVRPYTYEILRAIQPFFEIVVFSKLHHKILEHIIDHIESILNKPIKEFLEKYQKSTNKSSFQRMKKLPDVKIYFQFIIHQRQYIHIKEHDKHIENLLVLTKNRPKDNLIFISSNPFRIVTAIKYGFLTIPVIQFESFYRDDYQLSLVEHYILKIRHLKDMKKRLRQDFKCLVQKIENQPVKVPNYIKNMQSQSKQFDSQSQGSFGGKKLKQKVEEKKNSSKNIIQTPPVLPEKKVEPPPQIQKQPLVNKQSLGQFKPRKSSFGNISFGDPLGKGPQSKGKRQPQSDSEEELEDYDDEECKKQISELENEIKKGNNGEEKPKKKLLFTKIEENKIDENDEKDEQDNNRISNMDNNLSFNINQNNPQEQQQNEAPMKVSNGNQQDLMQYNFQIASNGSASKNPFSVGSFFRPGLEHLEIKSNSFQDIGDACDLNEEKQMTSSSLSQGGILRKQENERIVESHREPSNVNIIKGHKNRQVIVNQGNIVMNINKNVIHQNIVNVNKSSSSKTSSENAPSPQSQAHENESVDSAVDNSASSKVKVSNGLSKNSSNKFSDDSYGVKIVHGKVVYNASKVILEESKDNSMSCIDLDKKPYKKRLNTKNSNNIDRDSSMNMSGEIDLIYDELDNEQQKAQIQKINQEIENSEEI